MKTAIVAKAEATHEIRLTLTASQIADLTSILEKASTEVSMHVYDLDMAGKSKAAAVENEVAKRLMALEDVIGESILASGYRTA